MILAMPLADRALPCVVYRSFFFLIFSKTWLAHHDMPAFFVHHAGFLCVA